MNNPLFFRWKIGLKKLFITFVYTVYIGWYMFPQGYWQQQTPEMDGWNVVNMISTKMRTWEYFRDSDKIFSLKNIKWKGLMLEGTLK